MKQFTLKNRTGILACAVLVMFSMLLLGANQVTKELQARQDSKQVEQKQWQELTSSMVKNIPLEHKEAWLKAVEKNPQFFLKINTNEFVRYNKKTK